MSSPTPLTRLSIPPCFPSKSYFLPAQQMELRKACNHPALINGVEEKEMFVIERELRAEIAQKKITLTEGHKTPFSVGKRSEDVAAENAAAAAALALATGSTGGAGAGGGDIKSSSSSSSSGPKVVTSLTPGQIARELKARKVDRFIVPSSGK